MSGLIIQRAPHDKSSLFTQVSNNAIRDRRLSLDTRGLLTLMLSHSDGFVMNEDTLRAEGAGRSQARRMIRELEQAAYLMRAPRQKDKHGKWTSARWVLNEEPTAQKRTSVKRTSDKPTAGEPTSENDPSLRKNNLKEQQEEEKQLKEQQPPVVAVVVEQETDAGEDSFDQETATDPARPTLFAIYAEEIGKLTQMVGEVLAGLVNHHGEAQVIDAIRAAVTANVRTLAYVKGVLRRTPRQSKNDFHGVESGTLPGADQRLPVHWPTDAKDDFHDGRETPAGPQDEDWETAYQQLKLQLPRQDFEVCLRDARFLRVDEAGRYVIGVHNQIARDMLQHRLYRNVKRLLSDARGQDSELLFEAPDVDGSLIDSDLPVFAIREMEVAS